jgi:hypothetical protein
MDVFTMEQRLLKVVRGLHPHDVESLRKVVREHVIYDRIGDLADAIDDLHEADLEKKDEE